MSPRILTAIGSLAVLIAVVLLVTTPVAAQAPAAAKAPAPPTAKKWTAKTPDGQPDLQGYWTNSTYTPLIRPKGVTKEFYTKEEVANREKAAADRESEQTTPGTVADVHYDFTQFGLDRNQSRFVSNMRTSLIYDPADGQLPPVTPEGQKRQADRAAERRRAGATTDAVQNMPVGTRCIVMAGSGPPMMNAGYNSNYQIIQSPGYVMILTEMIHDVRLISLDGRPPLPNTVRQWIGSSRGHWEGDTLVVETVGQTDVTWLDQSGIPHSTDMKVTERITRPDFGHLEIVHIIDDPKTFSKPWTFTTHPSLLRGELIQYICQENNKDVEHLVGK
jgi:hypothetical protein